MRINRAVLVRLLAVLTVPMLYDFAPGQDRQTARENQDAGPARASSPVVGSSTTAGVCTTPSFCSHQPPFSPLRSGDFGRTVAVSGNNAVIGSPFETCTSDPSKNCGAAYFFGNVAGTWSQVARIELIDPPSPFPYFGVSVAIDGDVALVGIDAPTSGKTFRYDGMIWNEETTLVPPDVGAPNLIRGTGVDLSGDVAVLAANYAQVSGQDLGGAAYVFRHNVTGWVWEQRLDGVGTHAIGPYFIDNVAVHGDVMGIFVPWNVTYLFRHDGTSWSLQQEIEQTVYAIDVFADRVLIGTPPSSARMFKYNGTSWVLEQVLTASHGASYSFGASVALRGSLAIVGDPGHECPSGGGTCGGGFMYQLEAGAWTEFAQLVAEAPQSGEGFGRDADIDTETVLMGASVADRAYFFQLDPLGPDCDCDGLADACAIAYGAEDCNDNRVPDSCDLDVGTSPDCNGNDIPDECDTDCQPNGMPDDCDLANGTSDDCNANAVPDECDVDCNSNDVPDGCDIASGTSPDCNGNGMPDECESQTDCNNNGIQDFCELVAGTSENCNNDQVPDECQLGPNDCNGNLIPDDCESSVDCNGNGTQDFCDIALGTSNDCNNTAIPDECDIVVGTSTDANQNNIPDECDTNLPPFIIEQPSDITACGPETVVFTVLAGGKTPFMYQWRKDTVDLDGQTADTLTLTSVTMADAGDYDVVVTNDLGAMTSEPATLSIVPFSDYILAPAPDGVRRNRYIGVVPPSIPCTVAIRVRLVSLHHPDPPNDPPYPPRVYSAYEFGPGCTDPGGCVRWVGAPGTHLEVQDSPSWGTFQAASLQCTPHYQDWSDVGFFCVTGAEIIPSSLYEVEVVPASCAGNEDTCTDVSPPLQIATARWGDIAERRNPPSSTAQPDAIDITWLVNKFQGFEGALSNTVVQLQPNVPNINADANALDITTCVDALKGYAYPFVGPCPCPPAVTCQMTACSTSTLCSGTYGPGAVCIKSCLGGPNAAKQCVNNSHCPGGNCGVPSCLGGSNKGNPCTINSHCPGGVCNHGYCHDACRRCAP